MQHFTFKKIIIGIVGVTFLVIAEIVLLVAYKGKVLSTQKISPTKSLEKVDSVTFLAFGDINLGRKVGQRIIRENVNYPFEHYSVRDDSADLIFANLESQISDQKGETEHPKYNLIFTAPPEAISTLKNSGINILSTANNHAVDYGINALIETIDRLEKANIPYVGTSKDQENLYKPLIIAKNNIKFAIFGVTSFVNMTFKGWKNFVATSDTVKLSEEINIIRDSVDVIIVSYHGGAEYANKPSRSVMQFAQWCRNNSVDIFLGHHPHVTYGIEKFENNFVVHSLGNFVFYQPQHYWTQRSYGIKFLIKKKESGVSIEIDRFVPVNVSMQTNRLTDSVEVHKLFQRTQQLSNFNLEPYWK